MTKYAYYSKAGMTVWKSEKENQDSFFISQKIAGKPNEHIFGVADGHGECGRQVSSMIKSRLPGILLKNK